MTNTTLTPPNPPTNPNANTLLGQVLYHHPQVSLRLTKNDFFNLKKAVSNASKDANATRKESNVLISFYKQIEEIQEKYERNIFTFNLKPRALRELTAALGNAAEREDASCKLVRTFEELSTNLEYIRSSLSDDEENHFKEEK
tara:strand:+ start:5195 stop:5623 length:429 start_codon:yes stop_codon:yes gene_type:complete